MGIRIASLVLLLAGLLGCSSASEDPAAAPATSGTERCDSAVGPETEVRLLDLAVGEGSKVRGAAFGPEDADRVVVLLHQVGPFGWCGWARWAHEAAVEGVASLAVDLCGYGDSDCTADLEEDTTAQVDGVVAALGEAFPAATEVVVAGSSMGGHLAVQAVAGGASVDAWVDLSGPEHWGGSSLREQASAVDARDLPGLVLSSRSDGRLEYAASRDLARRTGATFVDGGSGHGYELLTRLDGTLSRAGRLLADFVRGEAVSGTGTQTLVYGGDGAALDVTVPEVGRAVPFVVLVHGSSTDPSPKDFPGFTAWADRLAQRGIATVVPNLGRDSPSADLLDAIAFARDRAPVLGLEPTRMGLLGFSAGGPALVDAAFAQEAQPVAGIAGFYAVVEPVVPGVEASLSEELRAAPTPTFLAFGLRDGAPGVLESRRAFLRGAAGIPQVTVVDHPTAGHAFDVEGLDRRGRAILEQAADWLAAQVRR